MGNKKYRCVIKHLVFLCFPTAVACTPTKQEANQQENCTSERVVFKAIPGQAVPALGVKGPCIVNEWGERIELRGVSIADPEHLERRTADDSALKTFKEAVAFGSSVIRIPIHKGEEKGWGLSTGISNYLDSYVNSLVDEAVKLGVYIIIDLHLISDYLSDRDLVRDFWEECSSRYGSTPNVIFELFNEPIYPDSWATWKKELVDPTMAVIRKNAPHTLVIVGSPHWSGHVADALANPVNYGPVAYTAHIYPETPKHELENNYHKLLGRLPLFVTEWGFNIDSVYPMRGTRQGFGDPTMAWLQENGISWTAWIYDNRWGQSIVNESWELRAGDGYMGELVRQHLSGD